MTVCPNCGEDNPDRAKFCFECGAALTNVEAAAQQARKTVTVVFSDMASSTALGERVDPESMRAIMDRYFAEVRAILERHGGTVEKFIGDAVMAVFGIPIVREDDALRAVRAAAEMRAALRALNEQLAQRWGASLAFRTGINTGEVIAGDPSQGQSFATGDPVNVAARLEQAAEPGEILIGDDTYRLVRDAVVAEAVEPLDLKGKRKPVAVWRLKDVVGTSGIARRVNSPLVGRQHDLAVLRAAFTQAAEDRTCHLVTILGAAGVGKSRLLEEFVSSAGERARVLRGRCLSYGEGITFWPVAEIVRAAAAISEDDSAEQARANLSGVLGTGDEGDEDDELIAQRVASLIGIGGPATNVHEGFWAVRRFLELYAEVGPVVVVLDDLHWAENTLLDLIDYLVEFTSDAAILLVCMARPDLLDMRSDWGRGHANATLVLLSPLGESDSQLLMNNLLGQSDLPKEARERISEAGQGNPLFVEEMIRMWIDEGVLEKHDGRWVTKREMSQVPVPPSINALLAARLDRLAKKERDILQRGSVVGQVFWWGSVAELSSNEAQDPVGTYLQALVRKELIRPDRSGLSGEDAFRFTHILIRDAAYNAMPKATRAELHERFASWLERRVGDRVSEYEEILAYHLEQAYRYRAALGPTTTTDEALLVRAGQYFSSAGRRAFARSDMASAAKLLERAASIGRPDETGLLLRLMFAEALMELGRFAEAFDIISTVEETAVDLGDERIRARARLLRAERHISTDPTGALNELRVAATHAIALFEQAGDDAGLAAAWSAMREIYWVQCRLADATDAAQRAIRHSNRAGDARLQSFNAARVALAVQGGPTPIPQAITLCQELLEQPGQHLLTKAFAMDALGLLKARIALFEEARRLVNAARSTMIRLGLRLEVAAQAMSFGEVEMLAGDLAAAERELRWGYQELVEMGERGYLSTMAARLAQVVYAKGSYNEAADLSGIADEAGGEDDVETQVIWRCVMGKVLARRGQLTQSDTLSRGAVDLANKTDYLDLRAQAMVDRAEALQLGRRGDEARSMLEEASRLYEQKGNIVSAAKALELLEDLTKRASLGASRSE